MNFDIKDVKSWANRHEVKVGDSGYVANNLDILRDDVKSGIAQLRMISYVGDTDAYCFSAKAFGAPRNFGFFLPLSAVKEDKPKEKKYRPFKTIKELENALNKNNTSTPQAICVGEEICLRYKDCTNHLKKLLITTIDIHKETREVYLINTMTPAFLFENFEIRVGAEWLPFGVEVEEE